MDTIDWDAFLKGWQGTAPTSPAPSSESKLLTSSPESAGPILSKSSSEPFTEPLLEFIAESAGPGLIGDEHFAIYPFDGDEDDFADPQQSPKTGKNQRPDK